MVHRDIKRDYMMVGECGEVAVVDWAITEVKRFASKNHAIREALDEVCSGEMTQVDRVVQRPIILVVTAVQVAFWAAVSRAVARARLAVSNAT